MSEKVVVITGASAGIGASLARELGRRNYRVVLAARRQSELDKVAAESGKDALTVAADVTKRVEVDRIRDRALDTFGHVDVWVNNAGQGITRSVLQLTDQDIDEVIAVNVKSALYGMQAIVPFFQKRGSGHLINVSSFLAKVPAAPPRAAYSGAKAMLNTLTANLRMELRQSHPNIHISTVMPGIVTTEFAKNAIGGTPGWAPPAAGPMAAQTPEQVAKAIAELIEKPAAELYTNPAHPGMAQKYIADVAAFEAAGSPVPPLKPS
ncbi:MAG: SDR family oxidoreductase [Myxococcaceae bacterium]